jgi:peroxiredoxin
MNTTLGGTPWASKLGRTAAPARWALLLAALLCSVFSLAGCSGTLGPGAANGSDDNPMIGVKVPAFSLRSPLGGGRVSPSQASGKVLIVDFWATWCAPCKESFPAYQKLLDKFGDQLMVIGVSVDDNPKGIPAFVKETGVSFPVVWDKDHAVSSQYNPTTMPTSFIVDQNGIVRFVHSGFHSGDEKVLESQIESLLTK